MAGRPSKTDKLIALRDAKEYYKKLIDVISDIESGQTERAACASHDVSIDNFRKDTLYKKKFGSDIRDAPRLYLSPYELIYEHVTGERVTFAKIPTLPVDLDETISAVMEEALNENELRTLELYYLESMTYAAIARDLNLSAARVRQIHHAALRKLRKTRYRYRIQMGDSLIAEIRQKQQEYRMYKSQKIQTKFASEINTEASSSDENDERAEIDFPVLSCVPIEMLNLSARAYNALRWSGIDTIAKLQECIDSGKLSLLRHVGKVTEENIICALKNYAYEYLQL